MSNFAKHGIVSVKQYNTAYVIVACVMQSLRTRVTAQHATGVIRCDPQQRSIYDSHSLARRSQRDVVRERSRFGTASTKQSVRQTRVNAKPGPGGGVLDRPTVLPGYDNKGSTVKRKPPMYRVMLHNDTVNRREYVVRVLMKVVDGLTVDDAVNVMQEAHANGMACVIECAQEDAERYCEGLRGNGLLASVEPAGGGGDGKPSD